MAAEPREPDELSVGNVVRLAPIQRLMPNAPEAEKALLCSFLMAHREIGQLCAEHGVLKEHFYLPSHGMIFGALKEFWDENEPTDITLITIHLRNNGTLEKVGGAHYITELSGFIGTHWNALSYIEEIKEKFTLREIILTCTKYASQCYDAQGDVPGLLFSAQRDMQAISTGKVKKRRPFKDLLMQVIQDIEKGTEATADVVSGITHLDSLVKMRRGNFIVIGGQAKSGKTALAGTIATNSALAGQRVLLISLEMDVAEMVKRMLASAGRVNVSRIGKEPTEAEFNGVVRGATALGNVDVELVDDSYDLNQIVAECRKLHLERPIDLIVIDYLQLIEWSTDRRGETRQEVVAQISRTCKKMAQQLNCVLIGLSQLNESGQLRESRAIGQDANVILGVDKKEEKGRAIRICDQRNGPSDIEIKAIWLPYCTTFENPKEPDEQVELVDFGKLTKSRPKNNR